MILKPYQYYVEEALISRVKDTENKGYIWHTAGSGQTLTSFKAAQILMNLPEIKKVIFVGDRKDLDYHFFGHTLSPNILIDFCDNLANVKNQKAVAVINST